MEFDTTTFILEIVNFLILLWILKRLFYRPVLDIIAKRRQHIDRTLDEARKMHSQAEELKALYENRQQLWEQEKKTAQAALQQEFEAERNRQIEQLHRELEQERQKSLIAFDRQQQESRQQAEKQALANGARFARLLLQQAAGPDLEARLQRLLLDQLAVLPEAAKISLSTAEMNKSLTVKVASVFPVATDVKEQLERKLATATNRPLNFQYAQDDSLMAGIRIDIGSWVLHADLAHELAGFVEIAYEAE